MMFGLAILWIISRPILVFARLKARNPTPKNLQQQGGGIIFDIKVTKDDLKDKEMMNEIKGLMEASAASGQKPKRMNPKLEELQGILQLAGGAGGGGLGFGMKGDDLK